MNARVALCCLMIGVSAAGPAFGQAKDRAKAERAIAAMKLEENWTITVAMYARMMVDEMPFLAPYRDIVVDYAEEKLGWAQVKEDVIKVYMSHYTDEELEALRKFYESPAGQKSLHVAPLISDEISKMVRRRFDSDLALLELRMKNRELDLLAEQAVFLPEEGAEKRESP